jgi:hypothetical protein
MVNTERGVRRRDLWQSAISLFPHLFPFRIVSAQHYNPNLHR